MAGSFFALLEKIRNESYSEKDKGTKFERLVRDYFRTSKRFIGQLDQVWLWNDFPFRKDFGGKDLGIDLVAKAKDGGYWAIQCKCYGENTTINKPAVDSFISTSGRTFKDENGITTKFSYRVWVATTESWGPNARETLENQDIPCNILNGFDIDGDPTVDWDKIEQGMFGSNAAIKEERKLKPHQKKALEKAHEHYKTNDRGQMIMACGTGKTFTALRLVEQETNNKGLILVLVPSIALINQTLNEWNSYSAKTIHPICVCSDSTASRKRVNENDDTTDTPVDLAMPACTDYKSVALQIAKALDKAEGMTVVYSTYQSIDVISQAQKYLSGEKKDVQAALFDDGLNHNRDYTFDFIVCDEAHRTTGATLSGKDESHFVKVHSNANVKAKHRLYMTATPRLYEENTKKKAEENSVLLCSMDDTSLYGKEFYRIGFGQAVEEGLLADYKVLILTVRDNANLPASVLESIQDKDKEINTDDAIKLVGCISALSKRVDPPSDDVKTIDPGLMHKAVAFCSRISNSKSISASYNEYAKQVSEYYSESEEDTVVISAKHIDGAMSAGERNKLVAWLKDAPTSGTECRVLTNVRCLSEGVDVPSLDAVIFLSARNSQVDVVQSVGRVMRTAPGKKYGYIIIPIVIPANGDPNTILDDNERFKVVWTVLNALRAHDDRFNAWVNKLELNDRKPKGGGSVIVGPGGTKGGGGLGVGEGPEGGTNIPQQILLFDDNIRDALYAKMVLKVGTKRYWEQWANDVAAIALRHKDRINRLIQENENYRTAFDMYMDGLHKNINPNIDEETAKDMLSQHMVTKPVFDALFGNSSFTESNPISLAMKRLLELVDETAYEKDQEVMKNFYKSVQDRCEGINNASGKQKIIIELYDKFFKKALSKTVEKLGIVYTPVEIVDFINQSVADVLKKEFGRKIGDENVHIIDPFTGTGTFITRMIQSGLIEHKDLPRKYEKELHANEIVLLAYYIASVNIENAYHDAMGQDAETYTPFNGICLTDTFQLYEDQDNDVERLKFADVFPQNSKRVIAQSKIPVQVIVGNPPYSIGQKSQNDNAANDVYPKLEKRISDTYSKHSVAKMQKGLYDSYIKAFRWASDRLDNKAGGIIGFVTNAGWIDTTAMDGLRKCFENEFSSIYVYNLRGNQRTIGEMSRKEGGKIFGSGSRAPIAVTILIKNPKAQNKRATIYYREVDDYLTREEKLTAVVKAKSVAAKNFTQKVLKPNDKGDWLNQRSDIFSSLIPIEPVKKFDNGEKSFFAMCSMGIVTSRDYWTYGFSFNGLEKCVEKSISHYNKCQELVGGQKNPTINYDKTKFSWSRATINYLKKNVRFNKDDVMYVESTYRPFCKTNFAYYKFLNEMQYQMKSVFPNKGVYNLLICVSGHSSKNVNIPIMCKNIVDYNCLEAGAQCFPLYWYEEKKDESNIGLFDQLSEDNGPEYIRHDGITDYILKAARDKYKTNAITKEDIFYYVYGLLHSQDYQTQFAADLKKMLPRLSLVDSAADFKAFSTAGHKLADLHLNYENRPAPAGVTVEGDNGSNYHVTKMKQSKDNTSEIIYNSQITIKNIPPEAYEYVVNGRTAIGWIMERYQVKTDKDSGIVNDPNDWAIEHNQPRYILDLLLSIITVSVETMKIVKGLPKLKF